MNYLNLINFIVIFIGIPCFIIYKLKMMGLLDLIDRIGKVFDAIIRYAFYIIIILLLSIPSGIKENLFNYLELLNYLPDNLTSVLTVKNTVMQPQTIMQTIPIKELTDAIGILVEQTKLTHTKIDLLTKQSYELAQISFDQVKLAHNALIKNISNNTNSIKDSITLANDLSLKAFNGQTKEILLNLNTMNANAQKAMLVSTSSHDLLINIATNGKEISSLIQAQSDLYMDGVEASLKANNANSAILQQLQLDQEKLNQKMMDVRNSNIESARIQHRQMESALDNLNKKVDEIVKPKVEEKSGIFSLPKISDFVFNKK